MACKNKKRNQPTYKTRGTLSFVKPLQMQQQLYDISKHQLLGGWVGWAGLGLHAWAGDGMVRFYYPGTIQEPFWGDHGWGVSTLSCHCQVATFELGRGPKCDDKKKINKTARKPTSRLWIESASFFFFHTGADSDRGRVSK